MSHSRVLGIFGWALVPLAAAWFVVWADVRRIERVRAVTAIADWSGDVPAPTARTITGYVRGMRRLVIPGDAARSFHWITQTQQAIGRDSWRVRHVDYLNAPFGYANPDTSPYRWYLTGLARIDRTLSPRTPGESVEAVALWADPLLHLALLAMVAVVAWRRFGPFAAALGAILVATLVPLAAEFVPGAPDNVGLAAVLVLASVLPLVVGCAGATPMKSPRERRWFGFAGFAGGLGLWLSPVDQFPILAGVFVGAVIVAWVERGTGRVYPWRWWALVGALTTLVGDVIETFSDGFNGAHTANTPILALAWLAAGAFLDGGQHWLNGRYVTARRSGPAGTFVIGGLLVAGVMAGLWFGGRIVPDDPSLLRLTRLEGGVFAPDCVAWLRRASSATLAAPVLLPAALLVVAGAWLVRVREPGEHRRPVLLAFSVSVVCGLVACFRLRVWGAFELTLLVLVLLLAAGSRGRLAFQVLLAAVVVTLAGVSLRVQWPPPVKQVAETLTPAELQAVIERDLAHWLRTRSGDAPTTIFAAPDLTAALAFYGGLNGIGTFDAANADGFAAAVRLASATSDDEARALVESRKIAWLVLPSWRDFTDEYVRLGLKVDPNSALGGRALVSRLRQWQIPSWLTPLAYRLPAFTGYERQFIAAFAVGEPQNEAIARSRLVEYLLEMEQFDLAQSVAAPIRSTPNDLNACLTLAQIAAARQDTSTVEQLAAQMTRQLAARADRFLPWDRRVSLAVFLAQVKRSDAARNQLARCLAELDAGRVSSLSPGTLFRFLALCRYFNRDISDAAWRERALELLPPAYRLKLR